ncbi:MAG: CRISPR-associated protein Csx14 [Thermoflexales bacterium]|nr:CRISPR-associated protein Csx14 [Thermoflexales bacterium]
MAKLLIATLGIVPAVITEAIDLLDKQGSRPDGVVLFVTQDPDVRDSLDLLLRHLPAHDHITRIEPVHIGAYGDIADSGAAVEFMQEACRVLKTYRDNGDRLFVCIAGGRKAMSALLALAVQFYGAERLFHIWVPPWIEEEGEITKMPSLPPEDDEEVTKKLHPALYREPKDHPRIVDLPFIGLFPLLGDILSALRGQVVPEKALKQMLVANGLLNPNGTPTPLGQSVAAILESVEDLPPARQEECKIHIGKHHYRDKLESFAQELAGRFPYVTEIQSDEWRQGSEQVKAEPPNVLIVGTHLKGVDDILFRFRLTTTATTEGQLEAARKDIERNILRR